MAKTEYAYRKGFSAPVPAEIAGRELDRLHKHARELRPADVVEAARPETSPLHPAFEWRDDEAAEKWRIHQARNLIRSVHVIRDEQPEPRYIHVPRLVREGGEVQASSYRRLDSMVKDEASASAAINELQRHIARSQAALAAALQCLTGDDKDSRLAKLAMLGEALATARSISERLQ